MISKHLKLVCFLLAMSIFFLIQNFSNLKFCVVRINSRVYMYVVVNVMLSLTSMMNPPPDLCDQMVCMVVKLCTLGVFALGVSLIS